MVEESQLTPKEGTAAARYKDLEREREPFLAAARDSSLLTIPSLIPLEGWDSSQRLPTPYQSIGARGVNNLASKLLLTLLPPNSPFFRLRMDPFVAAELAQDEQALTEIENSLSQVEAAVQIEVETTATRPRFFEGLKHLAVAGNVVVYVPDGAEPIQLFHLPQFVVERDAGGNLLLIIIREQLSRSMLRPDLEAFLVLDEDVRSRLSTDKDLNLYTVIERVDNDEFQVFQEIEGVVDPESVGVFKESALPWHHVRWNHISGEDYGRGHVEEYLGDLTSLEGLSQSVVEGSAAAARILFLTNPNGQTNPKILDEAPNGAVRKGRAEDISVLQFDKQADFSIALQTVRDIRDRLGFGFLLNTSVTRDAERVTAEEIRFVAQELEDALGGTYSMLSQEFQLPLVNRLIDKMQAEDRLPQFPSDLVKPQVVTGLEALGRGHDLTRIRTFIGVITEALGPEVALQHINVTDLITRAATASYVDPDGLIKTEEELAAASQQAQIMAMVEKLGPNAVNVLGQMIQGAAQSGALAPPQAGAAPSDAGS